MKNKKKIFIAIIAVVLVLALIGGGTYLYIMRYAFDKNDTEEFYRQNVASVGYENTVETAYPQTDIYDIIAELPDGFDTVLTERGGGLSEGQIQRISIARALLTDAPVLLLDEATSALDEETETKLLNNIKAMNEKTVLFITHRNTSLKVCDKIIHVEDKVFKTIKE